MRVRIALHRPEVLAAAIGAVICFATNAPAVGQGYPAIPSDTFRMMDAPQSNGAMVPQYVAPPPAVAMAPSPYSTAPYAPAPYTAAPYTAVPWTPAAAAPVGQPDPEPVACCERVIESTWYTRIDYFHWNERFQNTDLVNEDGPLFTLGYMRRNGAERFRGELFGSQVHYSGGAFDNSGNVEPLSSHTNYLGVRAEYDYIFEPEFTPNLDFFVGIGTRLWNRDLPPTMTPSGNFVSPAQEEWWTIYPYIGMERRRDLHSGLEFYFMGRIGLTAVTLEHSTYNDVALYPKPGITAQVEGGLRGKHCFTTAFAEVMSWQQSDIVDGWFQPTSTMVTVGLRTGASY